MTQTTPTMAQRGREQTSATVGVAIGIAIGIAFTGWLLKAPSPTAAAKPVATINYSELLTPPPVTAAPIVHVVRVEVPTAAVPTAAPRPTPAKPKPVKPKKVKAKAKPTSTPKVVYVVPGCTCGG